ncbi:3'-5' exonuclease [Corynebacterium sp. MSK218]|uniref:3'-5' exonuclease n=1 Tax=Corynebacterium sp. MSK218 TaxID=3050218 RepID=UPI002550F243|nr:3'-5' exonuclease [Corynebacterium sp. MSK218]MDK8763518.1 3'-5' exonuclease [Corynebacterium sp. MSK218]
MTGVHAAPHAGAAVQKLKGGSLPREKSHPTFLAQEYSAVILTQGIADEKTYLRARRTGRGTPLNRAERKAVWAIVEYFHAACASIGKLTYAAAAVVAAHIVEHRTGTEGMFDHVLIDEAQDFHAGHWKFLRAVAKREPNDIFIAEDSHQRIYGQRLVLRDYGIETRGRATRKLRVNYRTTRQNLGYATAILEGTEWIDSEEDLDDLHGYRSVRQGPAPVVLSSASKAEEAEALAAHVRDWASGEEDVSIGVLTRTNPRKDEIATQLGELGVAVSTGRRTSRERPVAVMTMHNAKGLEFTHVILLDVSREALPQRYLMKGLAPAEADEALQRERALLYVAASRARDVLVVSVVGEASELLPG